MLDLHASSQPIDVGRGVRAHDAAEAMGGGVDVRVGHGVGFARAVRDDSAIAGVKLVRVVSLPGDTPDEKRLAALTTDRL